MAPVGQHEIVVLFVDLKFKSEEDVQKFGEVFTPMTQYVKDNEAGHTYAYKLLKAEGSPLHLTIYERYESRSYWKDVHEQSQAYKDFVQRVKDAKLEIEQSVSVFYETDIGHM
ncbi:g4110 [Coccomyxa viridis]|uniref:G4110 protein n=1 Tax=Coccomyxa viridis TaxID=1274662 RepID=A0ABP1FTG6_9CHLO